MPLHFAGRPARDTYVWTGCPRQESITACLYFFPLRIVKFLKDPRRIGQERQSPVCRPGVGQHRDGEATIVAAVAGVVRLQDAERPENGQFGGENRHQHDQTCKIPADLTFVSTQRSFRRELIR